MTIAIDKARIERIRQTITAMQGFRFCGPSDDPDEISAVTLGYRHLLIQLQRSATPLLPDDPATRLNSLEVEPNDLTRPSMPSPEVPKRTLGQILAGEDGAGPIPSGMEIGIAPPYGGEIPDNLPHAQQTGFCRR